LPARERELKLDIERVGTVSALLTEPAVSQSAKPRACFVFAHGAGAGMRQVFMQRTAAGLAERNSIEFAQPRGG